MRASALGWVPIGPVAFHALMLARDRDTAAGAGLDRRSLRAARALLLVGGLREPAVILEPVHTWWGWSPVPGPGDGRSSTVTGGSVAAGLVLGWRAARSADERRRLSAVRLAIGVPLVVASATEVVLPHARHPSRSRASARSRSR